MRRLNHGDESGATAVIVALLLVVLFGMAAIVVDVGALYQEKRELQNGADAAALAIAQSCASTGCGEADATADAYANLNSNDLLSDALVALPGERGDSSVTVTTSTRANTTDTFLSHWFAPVLGINASTVRAKATAMWAAAGSAATLPLTFSQCEFELLVSRDADGVPILDPPVFATIYFHTSAQAKANSCTGDPPSGLDNPGGFGWLDTNGEPTCTADVTSDQWVGGDGGSGSPTPADSTGCTEQFFADLIAPGAEPVLMPIFSAIRNTGSNTEYFIQGFAAFQVSQYRFGGDKPVSAIPPCKNPNRCISGSFVAYYDYGSQPGAGAGDFGGYTISLVS